MLSLILGGAVPADKVNIRIKVIQISQYIFIIVNVLAVMAIILAIVFLVINIAKRNTRYR